MSNASPAIRKAIIDAVRALSAGDQEAYASNLALALVIDPKSSLQFSMLLLRSIDVDKDQPLSVEQIDQLASDILNHFTPWDTEPKLESIVGALGNTYGSGPQFTDFTHVDMTASVLLAIAYREDTSPGAIDKTVALLEKAGVLRSE